VLFLDEMPEFNRNVLEVLRQPIEDGKVSISRAMRTIDFPAKFMLVASMNPCPCGYLNHEDVSCRCSANAIQKYLGKISGPLMNRIDLHIEVKPVAAYQLAEENMIESSASIRERVIAARKIQTLRFDGSETIHCNAQMNSSSIKQYRKLTSDAGELLLTAMKTLKFSGRAHDRILKVSRTIADLDGSEEIRFTHLSEAIGYRSLDKEGWIEAAATKNKRAKKLPSFKVA
jgi:magnesium chelatase family protein